MSTNKLPLHLFHGEDNYNSLQKLKVWKEQFLKKFGEDGLEQISGKKLDLQNFETNLQALPFLAEKKMLIIEDFFKFAKKEENKKMSEIVKKTPDFTILVLLENSSADKRTSLYKAIKKSGNINEFKAPELQEITSWITQESKKIDLKIGFAETRYLAEISAPNFWQISSNLQKLKHFAQDEQINRSTIDQLITPTLKASIFKLTDALGANQYQIAINTLNDLKESGEELTRVFYMIVRHFRILLQVRECLEEHLPEKSIASKLKLHPYVAKKTSQQAKRFPLPFLKNIYQKLLAIDIDSKTGKIKTYADNQTQFQLVLEQLIIESCK